MADYRDFGFDDFLRKKTVVEEEEKAYRERIDREDREREQREKMRVQRVGDKNSLLYMMEQLINLTIQNEGHPQLEPRPLEDLGIPEDHMRFVTAHRFLNQLQTFGCFESVDRRPYNFVIVKPNLEKLKEYQLKLQKDLQPPMKDIEREWGAASERLFFSIGKRLCKFGPRKIMIRRGTKMFALLKVFVEQPNTPFKIQDLIDEGNPIIKSPRKHFKGEKDIDDTLRYLKERLQVNQGEYFPIQKNNAGELVSWKFVN